MNAIFAQAPRIEVVGAGRMGRALVSALRAAGCELPDPGLRGADGERAEVVLLAVPDAALAEAASRIVPGRLVGHLSGATSLDPLAPHERFSMHPLMTVAVAEGRESSESPFRGATAAVDASSERGLSTARAVAELLGMSMIRVEDHDRAAYHAAASIASNFLITVEWFAEQLATSAGVDRQALVPLVMETVSNWAAVGPELALTGPVARGDAATVELQRAAVAERLPEHLELFDALVAATERLSGRIAPNPGRQSSDALGNEGD